MSTPPDRPPAARPLSPAAGAPPGPAPAPRRGRLAGLLGLLGAVSALHAVVLREAMALDLPVPAARPVAAGTGERTQRALRVRTVAPAAAPADAAFPRAADDAAPAWTDAAPAGTDVAPAGTDAVPAGTDTAAAALPTPRDEPAWRRDASDRPAAPARSRAAPTAAPVLAMEAPAAAVPREPASFEVVPRSETVAAAAASTAEADAPPGADPAAPAPDLPAAAEPAATATAAGPEAPPAVRAAAEAPLPMPDLLLAAAAADPAPDAAAQGGARAAPAPEAGARNGGPPAQVPVYRTRIPPPALLVYDMRRGPLSGTGQLDWKPEGGRYAARLESKVLGVRAMVLESRGSLDADGIAPVRYTDERRKRATQAANFRRTPGGEGGRITYSGPSDEVPLPRGAQDRLSWMLQLAAIAAADPARVGPGGRVSMFVSGARADADVWTFSHVASEPLVVGERRVNAMHLVREPRGDHDTRAEVWLDPERNYLPVRARLSNGHGQDAGDALELMLRP